MGWQEDGTSGRSRPIHHDLPGHRRSRCVLSLPNHHDARLLSDLLPAVPSGASGVGAAVESSGATDRGRPRSRGRVRHRLHRDRPGAAAAPGPSGGPGGFRAALDMGRTRPACAACWRSRDRGTRAAAHCHADEQRRHTRPAMVWHVSRLGPCRPSRHGDLAGRRARGRACGRAHVRAHGRPPNREHGRVLGRVRVRARKQAPQTNSARAMAATVPAQAAWWWASSPGSWSASWSASGAGS